PGLRGHRPRRREAEHLVASFAKPLSQLSNVDLYSPRLVPGIGAHEGEPHGPQAGWKACQSAGAAEIARSNAAASLPVSAATSDRRFPDGSTVIGSCMMQCQPRS